MDQPAASPRMLVAVFAALVCLTLLTVGASFLELGRWHIAAGLAFATVKALLVALFFMHLLHSGKSTWLVACAGLFWFGILFVLTQSDYLTRHWQAY